MSKSANGQTICLASGNYGAFSGGVKSSMTTIKPEDGATVTMALHFDPAANITVDGIRAGVDPAMGLGAFLNDSRTHDITVRNSVFDRAQVVMRTDSLPANANVLFDHNIHSNYVKCSNCYEGRVEVVGDHSSNGVTIQNSEFYGGNSDGIQDASNGTRILNNEFHDMVQQGTDVHADSIQLMGSNTVIRGNYFHDNSVGIGSYDGADHTVVENNVFWAEDPNKDVILGGNDTPVVRHNTLPGTIDLTSKAGQTTTNATSTDNIAGSVQLSNGVGGDATTLADDYNLLRDGGPGAHTITGSPTFVGGTNPTTRAGFALTSSSLGHAAADDGTDLGANP